jgi:biopolymer transport protein ExbD
MDGAFGGSPRKRLPGINITPLVDVMLLLIIFFAISSSFEEKSGLDVSLPKSTEASAQEPVDRVITVGEDGQFQYGDHTGLNKVSLEAAVRESLAGNPDAVVMLKARDVSTYQSYIEALDVAKRCGVKKLVLQTKSVPAP